MRIGVTGHRFLADGVLASLEPRLRARLAGERLLVCISNLAEGADQFVAWLTLELGGELEALVPCEGYESTFTTPSARSSYQRLIDRARAVEQLPFSWPSDEAFFAAGKELVRRCDVLVALWDGERSRGLGGTADVVAFARTHSRPVEVYWPPAAPR